MFNIQQKFHPKTVKTLASLNFADKNENISVMVKKSREFELSKLFTFAGIHRKNPTQSVSIHKLLKKCSQSKKKIVFFFEYNINAFRMHFLYIFLVFSRSEKMYFIWKHLCEKETFRRVRKYFSDRSHRQPNRLFLAHFLDHTFLNAESVRRKR